MKVIAFNSSPRKNWNTSMILKKALEGAESNGAETKLIHLSDLNFRGCQSCFACKKRDGLNYGRCAISDDLTPLLDEVGESSGVLFGSPIYFGDVPGSMRNLYERILFPRHEYTKKPLLKSRTVKNAHFYTMNVNETVMKRWLFSRLEETQTMFSNILGPSESLYVTDTLQWDDYSKYVSDGLDEAEKNESRLHRFPKDLEAAYEIGRRIANLS
jgi:multimeric flavodoxin WrbA